MNARKENENEFIPILLHSFGFAKIVETKKKEFQPNFFLARFSLSLLFYLTNHSLQRDM